MVGTIIGLIIAGIIIGALARLFMPGRQAIGIIATIIVGIIGTLIGYWIAAALGVEQTNGIDWIRWIISIIVAIVLVAITASFMGRSNNRTLT
ncbi:MAG TPA: GlsB/YeaQ/YmgE family stress response membrane protein [Actinomycetales bacterium]|nr:GlsB/YeaQ/YmgE family stress response membrane protein [Actinomycetales bacterium]